MPEAEAAAKVAIALASGQKPDVDQSDYRGRPATHPRPGRRHHGQRQGHRRQGRLYKVDEICTASEVRRGLRSAARAATLMHRDRRPTDDGAAPTAHRTAKE